MKFVEGLLTATVAIIAFQGIFKYNLTTTFLYFFGLGETHAIASVKKAVKAFKIDVSKL